LKQHTGVHANFFSSGKKMRANLQVSSGLEKGKLRKRLILKSQSRAYLLWWGRAAITVGLSAYLIWRVHEELLHIQLNLTQPVRLVLVVGLAAVGIFLSTWLWRIFIPYPNQVPFRQLMAHYLVGMLSNNFLPGGFGGDAVRVITLRSNTGNTETALNSVLISRLVSLWSIAIVAVLAALLQLFYRGFSQAVPLLFISGAALIGTAWITIFLLGAPLGFLMRHLPQKWANWHARLHHDYKDILPLLMALVIALSIQVCAILINLPGCKSFRLANNSMAFVAYLTVDHIDIHATHQHWWIWSKGELLRGFTGIFRSASFGRHYPVPGSVCIIGGCDSRWCCYQSFVSDRCWF
jgi:uncharacterized membrane protein YbhN (UPF0104 family)